MASDDLFSFAHFQALIMLKFLSSLVAVNSSSSSHPVTREIHNTYLKTIKSSFLLTTGLAKSIESLSERLKREMDVASRREVTHINHDVHLVSQINTLNNRVNGFEKVIKALSETMDQRLSHTDDRLNEIIQSQSTILELLRSSAQTLGSSLPSTLSSRSSTLIQQAIHSELHPLTAQISKINSDVENFKDELKSDWYILKSQMMDIFHPAS